MNEIVVKSSSNISLVILLICITLLGYLLFVKLIYVIITFLLAIVIIFLIGNKTIRFKSNGLELFYSLSPFKRKKKVMYKEIFLVEMYKPYHVKSLIIHYYENNKKKKIGISIKNDIDKLDDVERILKKNGVSKFDMKGY